MKPKTSAPQLLVTEGVSGVWHYHLSLKEKHWRGLCDANTMLTSIPLDQWRQSGGDHLPKRYTYCDKCEAAARSLGITVPGAVLAK